MLLSPHASALTLSRLCICRICWQVSEVLALLLGRLALSREQAAGVVLRNPRVLLGGPRPAFMNLGFLVGLGVRPPELQAMLLKSSAWLTRPLKDLTMQWQFVTTAAKVGCRRTASQSWDVLRDCC